MSLQTPQSHELGHVMCVDADHSYAFSLGIAETLDALLLLLPPVTGSP